MSTDYGKSFDVTGGGKLFQEFDVGEKGDGLRSYKANTILGKFFAAVGGMEIMTPSATHVVHKHVVHKDDLKAFLQRQGISVSDRADKKELLAAYQQFVNTRILNAPRISKEGISGSPGQISLLLHKLQDAGFEVPPQTFDAIAKGEREFSMAALAATNVLKDGQKALLYLACKEGNTPMVKLLLEQGADPNVTSKYGRTPLHEACRRGDIGMANLLVQKSSGPNFNEMKDKDSGGTPLHEACRRGDLKTAVWLAERGAKLDVVDKDGRTPLDVAEHAKHSGMKSTLEDLQKVNFNKPSVEKALSKATSSRPPLREKTLYGLLEVSGDTVSGTSRGFNMLMQDLDGKGFTIKKEFRDQLQNDASERSKSEGVHADQVHFSFLIDDLAKKVGGHSALLYIACKEGNTSLAKTLLEAGANPYVRSPIGETPLHEAFEREDLEVAILLAENGASLDARIGRINKQTPVDIAKSVNNNWMIAEVRQAWKPGRSHFDFGGLERALLAGGDYDWAKEIIDRADKDSVNTVDSNGSTPLHLLIEKRGGEGVKELCEMFINKGADPEKKDSSGKTPLDMARTKNDIECVALLEAAISKTTSAPSPLSENQEFHNKVQKDASETGKREGILADEVQLSFSINDLANAKPPLREKTLYGLLEVSGDTVSGTSRGFNMLMQDLEGEHFKINEEFRDKLQKDASERSKREGVHDDQVQFDFSINDLAKEVGGHSALLYIACKEGNTSLAKTLLEAGTTPYVRGKTGNTPLHDAFKRGDVKMAILLAENGASLDAKNSRAQKQTPIDVAKDAKNDWMIAEVTQAWRPGGSHFDFGGFERALLAGGDYGWAKEIIDRADKDSVNTVDSNGSTPLHLLIEMRGGGKLKEVQELCKMFIDKGADPEKKDASGKTPLDMARTKEDTECIALLEKAIRERQQKT